MRRDAGTGGGVVELARMLSRVRDELGDRVRRHRRMHHQHVRLDPDQHDRREVLHRPGAGGNIAAEVVPRSQVAPSGALFATTSAAMLPPAPGRFSTTTGWPSESASLVASARARMSL